MSIDIYQEEILDHYRSPHNYGSIENPDASFEDSNPLCGDVVAVDIRYDGDRVSDVRFRGNGCAISQAAASMLTDMVIGHSKSEALAITRDALLEELGVPLSPARVKCALLGYKVMMAALYGVPGGSAE
jgi:nitrogen fixation protein NifU and related proteins